MELGAPFPVIVRSRGDNKSTWTRGGVINMEFALPTCMHLKEPYYCQLDYVDGFDDDYKVLVLAPTLVKASPVCSGGMKPVLGVSWPAPNHPVQMLDSYLAAAHLLRITKLDGSSFPNDAHKDLNIVVVMRIIPESWMKLGRN